MDDVTLFGIDLEVWNNMPVVKQIESIETNTRNIDENTKAILDYLREDGPLESAEPTEFEMKLLQTLEKGSPVLSTEEPVTDQSTETIPAEETPVEEPVTEEPVIEEPVTEEPVVEEEVPVDYQQLMYEEIKRSNELATENQLALVEHLEYIEAQNAASYQVDQTMYVYLIAIIPLLLVLKFFSAVLNPYFRTR